ncbi:hypothetical protein E6R60_04220 [Streptomyces sp. A0642]|uniref:hypothetical protein n=1 Tax=Streptomyces sp. A0642 TaxID=2563100 RepID=UPI0010A21700|nr:hypothetical protein [Streptomyces sp. A0642]THA78121.1 hypothetical protein E6R60_04220 [Streptomyces sp. A0642]
MTNRPERTRVPLLLTVVAAVLLTACSGADSDAAKGSTTAPAPPTPSATSSPPPSPSPSPSPTPTPTTAAEIAEAVKGWYAYGGETAMVSLIKETVKAQSGRPRTDLQVVIVDFEGLMAALDTARLFRSLPDPKTRTAWTAAIDHLEEGARTVLDSAPETSLIQSPDETAQAARGWHTFDEGTKNLKAAQARLDHAFGLKPSPDPWAAE